MTPYDVAMAAVVVAGMIWGAWRGITWQLASILSLVLGYAVAVPMSAQLAPRLPGEPLVARALAMLLLYVAVSAGVFLVAWSIRATLRRWKFEAYDRHLGMILGGMEGALLGVVVTIMVISLAPQTRSPILTSPSGRLVDRTLRMAQPVLPAEVSRMLSPFWAVLDGEGNARGDVLTSPAVSDEPIAEKRADRLPTDRPVIGDRGEPKIDPGVIPSLFEQGGARAGRAIAEQFPLQGPWGGSGGGDERTLERR